MTKAQLKYFAKKAGEYRKRHPKRAREVSRSWKARNPDWWKGRKYVQLLTTALLRGNSKSKVFTDAGITRTTWMQTPLYGSCDVAYQDCALLYMLSNGSKLQPIKSWQECERNPKAFLAPGNFKLVSK